MHSRSAASSFQSAYCNSPLCAPFALRLHVRTAAVEIGAYDNAAELPAQVPTFAHYLRIAGYRTVLSGKMHFCGPDQLHGFEERLTTDIYPADFRLDPGLAEFCRAPELVSQHGLGYPSRSVRAYQSDRFRRRSGLPAKRQLFDIARGNDRRPFCMVVSLTHPHDPFAIPSQYWNRYDEAAIEMPRVRIAVENLDPHSRRLRHVCGMDLQPITDEQIRAARRAYFGAVSYVDDQIGSVLQALAAAQLSPQTIVLVLADHGEMLGERGLWYKMSFFEPACRIPLLVHAPRQFTPGTVAQSVSLIDLLPTLLELAGDGKPPQYATELDGRSLLPHLGPQRRSR